MQITPIGRTDYGTYRVFCSLLDYSKEWPALINVDGHLFEFKTNVAMPREAAGEYGGCAEYAPLNLEQRKLNTDKFTYSQVFGENENLIYILNRKTADRDEKWPNVAVINNHVCTLLHIMIDSAMYEVFHKANNEVSTMTVKKTEKKSTGQATPKAAAPAKKAAAPKVTPPKAGARKVATVPAKPVKAPAKKEQKPVEPVAKPGKRVATAKVVPDPKNTANTRKHVANPLPKKGEVKEAKKPLSNKKLQEALSKSEAAKKTVKKAAVKAVVGVAKTITVDQLLSFAKSEKSIGQGGKFVQVLQLESSRKVLRWKLSAPIRFNGTLTDNITVGGNDILLLDAEAAKVLRNIDAGSNVTMKFKRI
jgi:hypothetical protein